MIRLVFLMAAAAVLAGCAASPGQAIVERITGGRVEGDRDGAVVRGMESTADAFPLAVAHCTRFGRKAQFTRRVPGGHQFACAN